MSAVWFVEAVIAGLFGGVVVLLGVLFEQGMQRHRELRFGLDDSAITLWLAMAAWSSELCRAGPDRGALEEAISRQRALSEAIGRVRSFADRLGMSDVVEDCDILVDMTLAVVDRASLKDIDHTADTHEALRKQVVRIRDLIGPDSTPASYGGDRHSAFYETGIESYSGCPTVVAVPGDRNWFFRRWRRLRR